MTDDFREKLTAFAARAVQLSPRCANEESTRLFLILPFLNVLGYDDRNPSEVCPEHNADLRLSLPTLLGSRLTIHRFQPSTGDTCWRER